VVSGSGSLNLSSFMVVCSLRSIILIDDYVTFPVFLFPKKKKMVLRNEV